MFHIKTLELVHWDFWRRFTLPLDAQIITIVGPNGSGKTTLLDALRTLFVDPPRAGLDAPTVALARGFDHILYISCNPQTLRDNVEALHATHRIAAAAAFDQFPYTHHLECGLLLQRR